MTSYAIPDELNFEMLNRMYPSTKTEYRKQPFNQQKTVSGSMVQVMLNKMDRSFLNPATLALNFNLEIDFTVGTAVGGATEANSSAFLMGSAWSVFSRFVSRQYGGGEIDQIEWPGRLVNTITSMTLNASEKQGMLSMGFNDIKTTENFGAEISLIGVAGANRKATRTFSIPLIGALNTSKLIPLVASDIQLDFTVASVSECLRIITTALTVSDVSISVKDVEIIGEVLTLEEAGFQQLLKMYPGVFNLKSQSYVYAAGQSLAGGFLGTTDQVVPFSLNSLKQFIWWTSPNNAWDSGYAGVNPNLQSYQLYIGSVAYPQQPVKATSVAECYYQNSKSFGAFYSAGHSGCTPRSYFAVASTAGGEYAAYTAAAGSATVIKDFRENTKSNKFYQVLDLEIINQLKTSLYSGISTRGSTNTLRLNIARDLPASPITHALHMYACYDVVLNFDYVNGKITYSN